MDGVDPRIISYSLLAVVVIGGTWAIRRMIAKFTTATPQRPLARPVGEALRDGDLALAARLATDQGDFDQAAALYKRLGRDLDAARALRQGKRYDDAADLFEQLRDYQAAAQCYKRAGNPSAQLRMLRAAGEFEAAAEVAAQLGDLAAAADLAQRAGRVDLAIGWLRQTGQLAAAARLEAPLCEQKDQWAAAAERWLAAGDQVRALACYDRAGDVRAASSLLVRLGRPEEAAERLVAARAFAEAAALFESIGAHRKAALNHQKAGDSERAIHCLSMAGDKLTVVKLRLATGQRDEALRVAQSVAATDAAFAEVSKLAAQMLIDRGDQAAAGRTLLPLLHAPLPEAEIARLGRQAVELLVAAGDAARARQAWDRLSQLGGGDPELDAWLRAVEPKVGQPAQTRREPTMALGPAAAIAPPRETRAVGLKRDDREQGGLAERTLDDIGADSAGDDGWPAGVPAALALRYGGLDRLGQGGNGVVFKAQDKLLGRTVVLKFMLEGSMPGDMQRKYFQREIKLAAQLNHPNIVQIYDMGETDGVPWYAMEFVAGKPLTAYMPMGQPIADPRWLCQILDQFAAALDHAHSKGLIHRDIKPDNVLVANDGAVKLLDFGLARIRDEGFGELSVLAGTPYYMAPEQLDGSDVDHRCDIYALGVVIFRAMTGHLPYTEGNVFVAHAVEPIPDPRQFVATLPARSTAIILRAMAKVPAERYQTCGELARDVRAAFGVG